MTSPLTNAPGFLELIEDIQRAVETLRSRLESRPRVGASRIAQTAYMTVLVRMYPEEAREVLAELDTVCGDRESRGPGRGGNAHTQGRDHPCGLAEMRWSIDA
jgi:hypothetical protein